MPRDLHMTAKTDAAAAASGKTRGHDWPDARRKAFLEGLEAHLNVTLAAAEAGVTPRAAYRLKAQDGAFAREWAAALDVGYAELELLLLRQSIYGSDRTETVRDGASGAIKQTKTVHCAPHGLAVRLLFAHRAEVQAFRLAEATHGQSEEEMIAQVKAQMDLVRKRLLALGEVGWAEDRPGEQDYDGQ